jgi:hypothetical protein
MMCAVPARCMILQTHLLIPIAMLAKHDLPVAVFGTTTSPASLPNRAEARCALRIAAPFPITVRGAERGERFTLHTVLDNLSATGLYLRIAQPLAPDTPLFVVVRLAPTAYAPIAAPGVAARCEIVRMERQAEGSWGVAMRFMRQRFLYALTN